MKLSIVIPAYNEAENIKPLVKDIRAKIGLDDYEIIIVDDHSSDETQKICADLKKDIPNLVVLKRQKGENGMGYALMEGSRIASGEYIIWMMGDRSDEIANIEDMIDKLEGGADMVIASRYTSGGSRGDLQVHKAMYGSIYTMIAKVIFGLPIHDITNAYRGFKKSMLDSIKIESGSFSISPEFAIKAHLKKYKLDEVPTTYINRRAGQAKFNLVKMGIEYVGLFGLKLSPPK